MLKSVKCEEFQRIYIKKTSWWGEKKLTLIHIQSCLCKKSLGSFKKWLIARRGNKAHFCIISQLHFICNISNNWCKLWKKLWARTPKNPFVFKDDNKVSRIPFHFFLRNSQAEKKMQNSHIFLYFRFVGK